MPKGVRGRTMIEKRCLICGNAFHVAAGQESRVRTCSRECGYKLKSESSKKPTHPVNCGQCGKGFETSGDELFCSVACRRRYRKARTERACVVCGKDFRSPPSQMHVKTCSTECGYKVRVSANKTEWIRKPCPECGKEFSAPPSQADARVFCSKHCQNKNEAYAEAKGKRVSGSNNPNWNGTGIEAVSATGRKYRRLPPEKEAASSAKRRSALLKAIPKWADLEAIEAIYREANRIEKLTGTEYHVDHIVPLQSRIVSGLHCESNLMVLPATKNISKSNRHWPDMP